MIVAFLTGLLGSLHCLSMCGLIAASLPLQKLKSKGLYQAGRISTYAFLGGIAGALGQGLFMAGLQQFLSVIAGLLVIVIVLLPRTTDRLTAPLQIQIKKWFTPYLKEKNLWMIGVLNGLLPCGLVYVAMLGALSAASFIEGFLHMAFFGLGTLPIMLYIPFVKNYLVGLKGFPVRRIIPVLAVCTGILLMLRGMNLGIPYLSPSFETTATGAVLCR